MRLSLLYTCTILAELSRVYLNLIGVAERIANLFGMLDFAAATPTNMDHHAASSHLWPSFSRHVRPRRLLI
ncbi:hypothetical protein OCA5_pHCG300830 (plasmid) [Afipia carboxidovorans OM5]|uniref:Uncharacterized protein n=1 Tax=Afipia carboxidovorans (strain ATCC 49405 / DSM 1227 / KCTC 32145 / OM5) TaxID=504832 RepID=F8C146_AFIC5|nr:hypothetical protein OCA4_pHCG3B00830 [Afipia carboxidovorans OM4]AEI08156.1 hypothetical protein OCA5_pHCG300830 [Afipia carboxidovorans OM5]